MKKRGISAIVATVLIVLISVASITIIWISVVPMVDEKLSTVDYSGRISIIVSKGYTIYDPATDIVLIQLKRTGDDEAIVGVNIALDFEGNSYSENVDAPEENGIKTYAFNLSNFSSPPLSAKVSPIRLIEGNQKIGVVTGEADIPQGEISSMTSVILDFGVTCEEGDTKQCGNTNEGACAYGAQTCMDESWGLCMGEIVPKVEICENNIDDDCDASKDEGCGCTPLDNMSCGSDEGECSSGTQTCSAGGIWGSCAGNVGSSNEVCNGLDDDCDGSTDEGLANTSTCGIGACASSAVETCNGASGWSNTCTELTGTPNETGLCDDEIDNDCNGFTDDDDPNCGGCTLNEVGFCSDGLDNDCDGDTDTDDIADCFSLSTTSGLIAWWEGENNALDSSGSGYDGTWLGNASYVSGHSGQGFDFSGSGSINMSVPVMTVGSTSVTFGGWIKWDQLVPFGSTPFAQRSLFQGFALADTLGGYLRCLSQNGLTSPNYAISAGILYHAVCVYNGTNMILYVNGTEKASGAIVGPAYDTSFMIANQGVFNGTIDEVVVFNRSLSAEEVLALYNL